MLRVSFGVLTEPYLADLAGLDPANLTVGDAEAAGDFMVGFGADEFQPRRFANRRSGGHLYGARSVPIFT